MKFSFGQAMEMIYKSEGRLKAMGQAQVFMEEQNKLPQLKIKLAEGATMPTKGTKPSDTGYDLTVTSVRYDEEYGFLEYGTGVFMEIPVGYEVKVYPRSSMSKYDVFQCNHVALIDESYRKEIFIRHKTTFDFDVATFENGVLKCWRDDTPHLFAYPTIYKVGDKIAQFEMKKKDPYELIQVDNVEDTGRDAFGSSGN